MKRHFLQLLAAVFAFLCLSASSYAQLPPELEQGLKDFEFYHGGAIDNINMAAGNLTLDIPLFSLPQRGNRIIVNYRIFHNNKQLVFHEHCTKQGGCITWYTWRGGSGAYVADAGRPLSFYQSAAICTINGVKNAEPYATVVDADGAQHYMLFSSATNAYESIDASGYHFDSVNDVLTDRGGTRYEYWSVSGTTPYVEDTNGNETTTSSSSTTITDTLGRVLQTAGTPNTSACPTGTTSSTAWAMPGFNGGTATYTFCYATTALQTAFGDANTEYSGNQSLLVGVVLPNGQSWQFKYGPSPGDGQGVNYGDIIQITLPTGGTIAYTYKNIQGNTQSSRWVSSRTVNANDVLDDPGGPHTWNYSWQFFIGSTLVNKVNDPLGNDTVYTPGGNYIQNVQYYNGAYTAGNLMKSVATTFTSSSSHWQLDCGWDPYNVVATAVTTSWPDGTHSQVQSDYDAGFQYTDFIGSNYTATYGNVIAKREYDWGASTPTRQTLTNYQALYSGAPNQASYLANHILDIPYSVTVQDGSGTQKAYTYYTYDGTLVPSGISTQHDSSPPAGIYRGNQVAVNRWLNTNSSYLSSTATVYDTGMVSVAKAPLNNPTAYAYSSTFAGAYPTSVTNALSQITSYNYDFNTGLKTSMTDPNNQPTSYSYDIMQRLTQINYPDGGQTNLTFNDSLRPATVQLTKKINSGTNLTATAVVDGLGRTDNTQLNSDPGGADTVAHTYDANGRKSTVTNPYRGLSDPTFGVTTYRYDATDRITKVIPPDGSTSSNNVSTIYADNCTTVTDQQSKSRTSCSDGLGRITSVSDASGSTTHVYNALDDLTDVYQGSQHRQFGYDSLSRLTSAANPESGTTYYGYDANGNLTSKQDARVITTTYCPYDALNRVVCKYYSDGTPRVNFFYDQAPSSWPAWSGVSFSNAVGRMVLACTNSPAGTCTSPQTALAYSYDQMGRTRNLWECTPIICSASFVFATAYTYDLAGDLWTSTRPYYGAPNNANTFTYAYNSAQQVTGITSSYADSTHPSQVAFGPGTGNSITYTPFGAIANLVNGCVGSGCVPAQETYTYNNRLQPVVIQVSQYGGNSSVFACTAYNYYSSVANPTSCNPSSPPSQGSSGNNGNVMGYYYADNYISSFAHTATYRYDGVNRLTSASATGSSAYSVGYTYDQFGNMTCSPGGAAGCNSTITYASNTTTNQITTSGFTYDAAGNLTADGTGYGTHTYQWDAENHMVSVDWSPTTLCGVGNTNATVCYTYDAMGQRVQATYGGNSYHDIVEWVFDPSGDELSECETGFGAGNGQCWYNSWVRLGGRSIADYMPTNVTAFNHADNLGSTTMVTAQDGTVATDMRYYPFGQVWLSGGRGTWDVHFAGMGFPETNFSPWLMPTPNRKFEPSLGRWMTPDPGGVNAVTLTDPQTWNMYAYVGNNPTTLSDPSGLDPTGNGRIDASFGPSPSQVMDILLGAGKSLVNAVTSSVNALGGELFGVESLLFGGRGSAIPQLTAKNDYQAAGMVLGAVGLFLVPGGEEEGLTVGKLAEAFGFKSAESAGSLVGGQLESGASVGVYFSKEGSTLNVAVPFVSGPTGTVGAVEAGAVSAARAAGTAEARITAVNPNDSMARLLRQRGYTQIIEKGKATGKWVKTIKVAAP